MSVDSNKTVEHRGHSAPTQRSQRECLDPKTAGAEACRYAPSQSPRHQTAMKRLPLTCGLLLPLCGSVHSVIQGRVELGEILSNPLSSMIASFRALLFFVVGIFAYGLGSLPLTAAPAISPEGIANETATQIQYLSGRGSDDAVEWDFFCSDGRRSGEWAKIKVPSCWEQEGFGTYQFGMPFYGKPNPPGIAREQGKYRREFTVPAEWRGRRVRIVFEGAMTDTQVRVNGISAGAVHQGGFYRFNYDITDLLRYGANNQIEVTVDKESANESVNLAERRADYWNFGGIFRPVYLEALPANFIERGAIDARADGSFRAEVFLGGAMNDTGAEVLAQLLDVSGASVGDAFSAPLAAGSDRVTVRTQLTTPRLWTAETPNLYQVRLALRHGGAGSGKSQSAEHIVTQRFGFRTFEVRAGDGLYLNGQRVILRGVNRHSFWPETGRTLSAARNVADVRLIKELNMNAVRMSHYPPDAEFLDACDELGLYVLDELGGWHGKYDTGVGRKLVSEMVRRDVNHPSILFWDNGNEGGWNTELDGEFAQWDPQRRPVLHPQKLLSGVETMHYRSYGETQEFLRGPDVFMPTEFLHGLYDGGIGAGLWDYWEMMRQHPRFGGGFLWAFADEGVLRTDQNGRIDNAGAYAPDGIVGPHHEREGSFNTVREVWSPVQIVAPTEARPLAADFNGVFRIENRYDFSDLARCTLAWQLVRFPAAHENGSAVAIVAKGELRGPTVPPHAAGEVKISLPADWHAAADALLVTARGPAGEELWTWSWRVHEATLPVATKAVAAPKVEARDEANQLVVVAGALELRFDKTTGRLARVTQRGQPLSLSNGPRFIAARRGNRTLDGSVDPEAPKGVDRVYNDISGAATLTQFAWHSDGADVVIEADYFGALRQARWRISGNGAVRLDYEYAYDGVVELMGVQFDYPESAMRSIRWLGRGPYRVWQNRLHGTTLGVWDNAYNDTMPGESFVYPEFKGYFRDWSWAAFTTTEGKLTIENGTPGSFLGVYTPRDGRDALLYTLPATGLAILDVIPAVRNKVNATDLIGPSSQAQRVEGMRRGRVNFRFETK